MPTSPPQALARESDLSPLGQYAETQWRLHRPKLVKALEASGELYQRLKEAENAASRTYEQLMKSGKVDDSQAREIVMQEYILLPDYPDAG